VSDGAEKPYANIREILGELIGKRVEDVTQHDADEWAETKQSYIMLQFEGGVYVKFFIGDDGFCHNCSEDDEEEEKDAA